MKRFSMLTVAIATVFFGGRFLYFPTHSGPSSEARPGLPAPADSSAASPKSAEPSRADDNLPPDTPQPEQDNSAAKDHEAVLPELLGVAEPADRAPVRAGHSGMLRELMLEEGSSVNAGEPVAKFDDTEILAECKRQEARIAAAKNQLKEAEAQLELAQYERDKKRELVKRRVVTQTEMMESAVRVRSAAAKMEAVRNQVAVEVHYQAMLQCRREKHQAVAPFAGTVTEIVQYANQYVAEGEDIMYIESHKKQLKVLVPSGLADNLHQVQFSLSSEGQGTQLKIRTLKPIINPDGSRTAFLELPSDTTLLTRQIVRVHAQLLKENR